MDVLLPTSGNNHYCPCAIVYPLGGHANPASVEYMILCPIPSLHEQDLTCFRFHTRGLFTCSIDVRLQAAVTSQLTVQNTATGFPCHLALRDRGCYLSVEAQSI